jgi:hypothetical protein
MHIHYWKDNVRGSSEMGGGEKGYSILVEVPVGMFQYTVIEGFDVLIATTIENRVKSTRERGREKKRDGLHVLQLYRAT